MSSLRATHQAPGPRDVDTTRLARHVLIVCLALELAFVALDYFVNFSRWTDIGALRRMFNIAREDGLASWFGVTQTLLIALTLWLVFALTKREDAPGWRRYGWLVVALFFTYMAVDDGAQLHERLGATIERLREASGCSLDFFPSYAWQLFFLPAFAAVGLFMFVFLWTELGQVHLRVGLVLAMALLALAVGLDFIEGLSEDHRWNIHTWLSESTDLDSWTEVRFDATAYETLQHFSRSVEEALEMAANSILWFLFLRHLGTRGDELHIRFRD